ncbi:OLC1v1034707C1 [Oldenlandia corymbosa var. corymbosa]|uniref:OLC1v1034707C1 n=1 Tax=Oldenlandia corymbosa var. corymbosa TaxID=529605 RepID=A0AAV1CRV8_OLDCO|nr:OLC1v1034707C1 [Oldenlandia corymbosa var. corymbosa]
MELEWLIKEFGNGMIKPLLALSGSMMGMVLMQWQKTGLVRETALTLVRFVVQLLAIWICTSLPIQLTKQPLHPDFISSHGLRWWLHCRAASRARARGKVRGRSVHLGRNFRANVILSCAKHNPSRPNLCHPDCGNASWILNEGHWGYTEKTQGGYQDAKNPGRNSVSTWGNSASGHDATGEEVRDNCPFSGTGLCQDTRHCDVPGRNDGASAGRGVAYGGDSPPTCDHQHAYGNCCIQ